MCIYIYTWRRIHTEKQMKNQDFIYRLYYLPSQQNKRHMVCAPGEEYCVPNERWILDRETNPQRKKEQWDSATKVKTNTTIIRAVPNTNSRTSLSHKNDSSTVGMYSAAPLESCALEDI